MKDLKRNPVKHISLVFLTVTALGLTSSWLSSCSDIKAATTVDHTNIETRLDRIEKNQNDNVKTTADLIGKLSSDIGDMSIQIGIMADRIVETEYLIVQVVTNQTAAAERVIDNATNADGSPMLDKTNLAGKSTADLLVLNQILKGHSGSNGVLLTAQAGANPATTTNPPNFTFTGIDTGSYVLLLSNNGIFGGVNSSSEVVDLNNPLATAWKNMLSGLGVTVGAKVFYAVKTVAGGQLSAISNTLNVTVQ